MKGACGGRILPRIRGIPHVRENWPCYFPRLRDFEGLLLTEFCFVRYCFAWGRLGRRMHDKVGFVAEGTESFGQKAEVTVPEKLVGVNGEVGVEQNFQGYSGLRD